MKYSDLSRCKKCLEQSVIDCAAYSHPYYDDLVETYWNGSFWTPWVEEITTDVVNYGVVTFSNILYTAIKEVGITLPDFTSLAINMEIDIPDQIYNGTTYKGTINITDWQGTPLDANLRISRSWIGEYSEEYRLEGSKVSVSSKNPFLQLP